MLSREIRPLSTKYFDNYRRCDLLEMRRITSSRDALVRAQNFRLAVFLSLAVRVDCFLDSLLLRWIFDMIVTPGPNWACMATMKSADKRLENALTRGLDALVL